MNKKVLIALIVVVGLLAAGAVTWAVIVNQLRNEAVSRPTLDPTRPSDVAADPALQEAQVVPDLSTDLGACSSVTRSIIDQATGLDAREPKNLGIANEGRGNTAQTCVYSFDDSDSQTNRFVLTITAQASEEVKKAALADYPSSSIVSGVGETAYYVTSSLTSPAQNQYTLAVFNGLNRYSLTLIQPTETDAFAAQQAKNALITIAGSISF